MTTRESTTEAPDTAPDEETQVPDPANEAGESRASDTKDPAWYRKEIARRDEEISDLKGRLRRAAFAEAGIPTDSGLGKAIADLYNGDPDPAEVLAFAQGYGWEGKPAAPSAARKVEAAQAEADAITAQATSIEPSTIDDEIAKAEGEGRYQDAFNLKMRKMQEAAPAPPGAAT